MSKYQFCKEKEYILYQGKMQDVIDSCIKENSIDSIITDPPYELNFMGKGWDNSGVAFQKETWERCYKALKPGGYLLAFGGSRTFHRIACAIEDAGFEIRDCIMWLYGSGFPKSQNISKILDKKFGEERPIIGYTKNAGIAKNAKPDSTGSHIWSGNIRSDEPITNLAKQWQGWGTCLKPAFEPIIVARKPFKGSLVDNVLEYGVGGLNIDECRVETNEGIEKGRNGRNNKSIFQASKINENQREYQNNGRFPANVILTYDKTDFDEVCGGFPSEKGNSTSRYFYCAKASKKDRDEGLDKFEEKQVYGNDMNWGYGNNNGDNFGERIANVKRKNTHPTVKSVELMQYLIRLVTPKNGVIMDCFMGSGSTGKATMFENRERNANYKFIGIEMVEEYLPICQSRIDYALNKYEYDEIKQRVEEHKLGIQNIFDFM